MKKSRSARALYIILTLAVAANLQAPASRATEQRIDLDGNPLNGAESKVITKVLSSYPVQVENTVINNASGRSFQFTWPGAGPAGFSTSVTVGPDVGARWVWSSTQVIYSIESPITFTPTQSVPVFGQPPGGIMPPQAEPMTFIVPGKSIYPTSVTLSNASLTSSLITFFSPPTTKATCGVSCVSGQCDVFVENLSGGTATVRGRQPGCCLEPQQILCGSECYSYLEDPQNCGGCGITCGVGEICSNGECMCPGEGQTQCGDGCFDLSSDASNCGVCDTVCGIDESCSEGTCVCPGGETQCGDGCFDLMSDVSNCGACDAVCGVDESCAEGACSCPGEETLCGETCVDLYSDPSNCGSCGFACGVDLLCDNYTCFCPLEGQTDCGGTCTYVSSDRDNCGACGVACGEDQFCYESQCFCLGEGLTNCGGACVDLQWDGANCGSCGNICGEGLCCIDGECSPYCEQQAASMTIAPAAPGSRGAVFAAQTLLPAGASPVSSEPSVRRRPRPDRSVAPETGQSKAASSPRRGGDRPAAGARKDRDAGAPSTAGDGGVLPVAKPPRSTAALTVEEAPLCDIAPFEGIVPDGERFEFSQTGGRYGKEVQIGVTLEANGELIAQGPCPVIVPVIGADTTGVVLSPVKAATLDASGDAICQPSEGHCNYFLSLDNVGDTACLNPVATLSSVPDEVNPEEVTFLNATSAYPSWGPWPGGGLPPDRQTNLTAFSIAAPEGQGANTGRNFQLSVTCANVPESIVTPFVLGIGGSCNPATDLNGQNYDTLDGFRTPINSPLILEGGPVDPTMPRVKRGNSMPLKLRLGCGALFLDDLQIDPNPEIVSLVHQTLGPVALSLINFDDGTNPLHPFFRCDTTEVDALLGTVPQCQYNLRTKKLPLGEYVISVRMPDSRVFQAGFTIRP